MRSHGDLLSETASSLSLGRACRALVSVASCGGQDASSPYLFVGRVPSAEQTLFPGARAYSLAPNTASVSGGPVGNSGLIIFAVAYPIAIYQQETSP